LVFSDSKSLTSVNASSPVMKSELDYMRDEKNISFVLGLGISRMLAVAD
jgi:hypothetical protein